MLPSSEQASIYNKHGCSCMHVNKIILSFSADHGVLFLWRKTSSFNQPNWLFFVGSLIKSIHDVIECFAMSLDQKFFSILGSSLIKLASNDLKASFLKIPNNNRRMDASKRLFDRDRVQTRCTSGKRTAIHRKSPGAANRRSGSNRELFRYHHQSNSVIDAFQFRTFDSRVRKVYHCHHLFFKLKIRLLLHGSFSG